MSNIEYTSQYGQDKFVIENVYKQMTYGFFVEIGAVDGKMLSNTYCLEKNYNWEGICIEPNPHNYKKLIQNRNCICSDVVVSTENGQCDFFAIDDEENKNQGLSCFSSIGEPKDLWVYENENRDRPVIYSKIQKIKCGLYSLFEQLNAPKMVHYLSIDTECNEYEILKQYFEDEYIKNDIGWRRRIPVISVEHNYDLNKKQKLKELMEQYHYVLASEAFIDDIYIHKIYHKLLS